MLKHRLLVVLVAVLAIALLFPAVALGFNWRESPVSPLVSGGVHSTAKFKQVFLHNSRVVKAIKGVIKADNDPSWVYSAAAAQVKAGKIFQASLATNTHIGAMAFGPRVTKIVKKTVWTDNERLPYYYAIASRSVVSNGFRITTSYRVCLAKTCGNPFVFMKKVTKSSVSPPLPDTFALYVDKYQDSQEGTRLAGWEVTGTVLDGSLVTTVDVTTTDTASTLVGYFDVGSTYDLTEIGQPGWAPVPGFPSEVTGVMPDGDVHVVFVNQQVYNLYVEKRKACFKCDFDDKDWNDCWQQWDQDKDFCGSNSLDCLKPICSWVPGKRLGGWEITGTVLANSITTPVDVTTTCTAPTLVGQFPAGATFDLSEVQQEGWLPVCPVSGEATGTMPADDLTVTFVNMKVCRDIVWPPCAPDGSQTE